MSIDVKRADDMLLTAEGYYLFNPPQQWVLDKLKAAGLEKPISSTYCLLAASDRKRDMFMKRFLELNGVKLSIATDEEIEPMVKRNNRTSNSPCRRLGRSFWAQACWTGSGTLALTMNRVAPKPRATSPPVGSSKSRPMPPSDASASTPGNARPERAPGSRPKGLTRSAARAGRSSPRFVRWNATAPPGRATRPVA